MAVRPSGKTTKGSVMSSVLVSNPQDLSSNSGQPSLRLREINLPDRIKALREITLSLLTELESLESLTAPAPERSLRLEDEVKRFEIGLIRAALVKTKGNQARAARLLGVKHTTLNSKIKRYQIQQAGCEFDFPRGEQEMVA
jgi:transcriptional regulator with GAF, ATPase, and Fis domain